jgi:hypothetical protein
MAKAYKLTPMGRKLVGQAVDALFNRAKMRLLGPGAEKMYGKQLVIQGPKELSLTGLYHAASNMEGVRPREDVLKALLRISGGYLDATREKTKAKLLHSVEAFLSDARAKGVKTDLKTVLGGQLTELWRDVAVDVKRIVETETTVVRNTSIYDAIGRMSASVGEADPTVFFVTVRDKSRCKECTRLHVQPDGVTPRVWKQSELGAGYHKRGEETPKIGGLHPHCRCVLTMLMKGYGFNKSGHVAFISIDHDEYKAQRG